MEKIEEHGGGVYEFTQGYKYFGVNVQSDNTVVCREWAPGAQALFLTGEFSNKILFVICTPIALQPFYI